MTLVGLIKSMGDIKRNNNDDVTAAGAGVFYISDSDDVTSENNSGLDLSGLQLPESTSDIFQTFTSFENLNSDGNNCSYDDSFGALKDNKTDAIRISSSTGKHRTDQPAESKHRTRPRKKHRRSHHSLSFEASSSDTRIGAGIEGVVMRLRRVHVQHVVTGGSSTLDMSPVGYES